MFNSFPKDEIVTLKHYQKINSLRNKSSGTILEYIAFQTELILTHTVFAEFQDPFIFTQK